MRSPAGGTIAHARSSTASASAAAALVSSATQEPDLDHRRRVVRVVDVVDGDVRPALRVEESVARVAQPAVGVELDPALGHLQAEVRDARRTPSATAPLGAVRTASATIAWFFALAAHLEHPDRRLEAALGRRGERRVGRDEDLRVAGAGRERGRQPQRVAQVADVGRRLDRRDRLPSRCPRSAVPLATTRAVRPAAMTLTLPPAGQVLERIERAPPSPPRAGRA